MNSIDARTFQNAFLAGASRLDANKEWINELNVFPVPDGDTGTNMTMTIMSAVHEVSEIDDPTMESLSKAISSGSLRGARGNSGVILSQLFRGFTREIKDKDYLTTAVLADAFTRASETAYKAIMKPKEGTILTVAKGMAEKAVQIAPDTDDIIEFLQEVINEGDIVLARTPELLPVLKQAGVVDSGGQGLMEVLKGILDGLTGKQIDIHVSDGQTSVCVESENIDTADIKFGYCTEFIIRTEKAFEDDQESEFKSYLASIGDCVLVISDEDVVKVHVHTNDPGLAIQKALTFGSLSSIKVDNMREQHTEKLFKDAEKLAAQQVDAPTDTEPKKPYGFICVASGEGFKEIFKELGMDHIIEGGQTMNPSTEDILNAVELVNAETIYVFPNNSNIVLAAEQAAGMVKDKQILVVPTGNIPQGITAIINFAPDLSPEENLKVMTEEMNHVKTGQITYSIRDTKFGDQEISQGDIMGINGNGIVSIGQDIEAVAFETVKEMLDDDSELITIYYGSDTEKEKAEELFRQVEDIAKDCEVELQDGGQPIYYYIISVE